MRILAKLSKKHRVIVPTMPGFTPSFQWKKKATPEDFSLALTDWFTQMRLQRPQVIGHSLGGVLAVLLASKFEKKIKSLILIDTVGVPVRHRTQKEWRKAWVKKRIRTYARYGIPSVSVYVDSAFFKNAIFRTKDLIHLSKLARLVDIREYVREMSLPVTVLWGDEDVFTPFETAEKIAEVLPHAKIKKVPGNHDWPVFEPERLIDFL